jgi:hypothetical protein
MRHEGVQLRNQSAILKGSAILGIIQSDAPAQNDA